MFSKNNLVVDTPLLLVYMVGCYDPAFISEFDRTKAYNEEDFSTLSKIFSRAKVIYITPQVLAELSNFSFYIKEPRLKSYLEVLIQKLANLEECYIDLKTLLFQSSIAVKIGFTDLSLIEVAKKKACLLITPDFKLTGMAKNSGCDALNYTQLRAFYWGL